MLPFRILIADDHEVVRHGLTSVLKDHDGWQVCGQAVDGLDAVNQAAQLKPDLVILDVSMPNLNGLEAARHILHDQPRTGILIMTIDDSEQMVQSVVEAGARGFVLKSDATRDLVKAVEALQRNRTFFTARVPDLAPTSYRNGTLPPGVPRNRLTVREREVVRLLAEGKTTKEVAGVLGMSVKTAETHRANIMRKLDFHSVSQLILYAVRNRIVPIPQLD
jgi:DNA-binding NarL/FixJ family response regulator